MSIVDQLLDASILRSFDRSGFKRHSRQFRPGDLEVSLKGKVALVTGANKGIGYSVAQSLGKLGAEVWMLCRNPDRGEKARSELQKEVPEGQFELLQIDMSSLTSVRAAAVTIASLKIDILIHNAGVLPTEYWESPEGLEGAVATNLVGPYLLTKLLLPQLRAPARVIWVSSGGMYGVKLSLEELKRSPQPYDGVRAYAQTKRSEIILARLMAKRYSEHHHYAMHPGWVETEGVVTSLPRFYRWTKSILRTTEQGADTIVWLAAVPKLPSPNGSFWLDRVLQKEHLFPLTKHGQGDEQKLISWLEETIKSFSASLSN